MAFRIEEFPVASIDLVYRDPPFNWNADYDILLAFRLPLRRVFSKITLVWWQPNRNNCRRPTCSATWRALRQLQI